MQNEALKNLLTRRSCRSYTADPVPAEALNAVLEAGTYAPTAMGRQSPQLVAVRDKATRDELSRLNAAVLGTAADPFYGAPVVVLVFAKEDTPTCIDDAALVMGNLMNAAHAVGLGSCWINRAREVFAREEGKALLRKWGLPETLVGVGHCILGVPAGAPAAPAPRRADYIKYIG